MRRAGEEWAALSVGKKELASEPFHFLKRERKSFLKPVSKSQAPKSYERCPSLRTWSGIKWWQRLFPTLPSGFLRFWDSDLQEGGSCPLAILGATHAAETLPRTLAFT